jgi:hypothetical protein
VKYHRSNPLLSTELSAAWYIIERRRVGADVEDLVRSGGKVFRKAVRLAALLLPGL